MAQNDPWAEFEVVEPAAPAAPAPASPAPSGGFTGFIPGTPKPPKPNYRQLTDEERVARGLPPGVYQLSPEGKVESVPGTQIDKTAPKSPEFLRQRADAALSVLTAIQNASEKASGWTAGMGSVLANIPGTDARNLRADIDTIKANLAFDQLQAMRDNSPTGGAVGNVTERELELLGSTVASLDQAQDPDQLKERLKHIQERYSDILNRLGYTVPAGPGTNVLQDGGPSIRGPRLSPEDEKAYLALIRRVPPPSPQEIMGFFSERGLQDLNAEATARALAEGARPASGVDYGPTDEAARARAEEEMRRQDEAFGRDSNTQVLARTGMSLGLADEAAGVGRGLSYLAQGRSPIEGYRLGRDADRLRQERAREEMGYLGTGIEIGGGLLSANPRTVIAPLTSRTATILQGAKGGAVGGGVGGFGYGEGAEGSVANALLGAGAGAAVGGGISALASRRGVPSAIRVDAPETVAAAERMGFPLNAGNVRPGARNVLAYLEASPGSAGPVQRNLAAQAEALREGTEALGAGGKTLDQFDAGQTFRGAGERFLERSRTRAGSLYDRAARAAGDVRVSAESAVQRIRARIAELSETPSTNQSRIEALQSVLEDLVDPDGNPRPLTVEGVRNIRTGVRAELKRKGLTATQAETDSYEMIDAISDDLLAGLREQSPEAARYYQRADAIWRERKEVEKDILHRVLGKENERSAEQVFLRVQALARTDRARASRMMQMLTGEERQDIAATIANSLGRKSPDADFSPAYLVANTSKLSRSARELFFGREGAHALDDLERLAKSYQGVVRSLNASRSGQVSNYRAFFGQMLGFGGVGGSIGTMIGGPAGGATGGAAGAAIGATVNAAALAARRITANMLTFRPFVRWLGRAPKTDSPQAIQAHIRQLGGLGRGTPIAADMQALQQSLMQQFAPAAASGDDQKKNR